MEPTSSSPLSPLLCVTCHQSLQPEYYFCPNCGTQVKLPPLSTSSTSQLWLYSLSIILPSLCYIIIGKWKGLQYLKSEDKKAKTIGIIATLLLVVSTVLTFWYVYMITQKIIQQALTNVTSDIGGE